MDALDEPVEARGDGAPIFSAPTTFFLTFREPILRWHQLKHQADEAVHEFLMTLQDDLDRVGREHGLALTDRNLGRKFFAHLLTPQLASADSGAIAFGVGWRRGTVVVDDEALAPYVGIWVDRERGGDLRERFLTSGEPTVRERRDRGGYRSDRPWPVYRRVQGRTQWWADLDGYREAVVRALESVIADFGHDYRQVVSRD